MTNTSPLFNTNYTINALKVTDELLKFPLGTNLHSQPLKVLDTAQLAPQLEEFGEDPREIE